MASKKPKGLGLGLEALLGPKVSDAQAAPQGDPTRLPLSRLQAGRYQPRTRMDEGSLYELAESIRSQGVMQPVLVRPLAEDGRYEIIAGERRYRAAALAGLEEIPVLVRHVPDEAAAVMALIENIQREDLNPIDEAKAFHALIEKVGLTHDQLSERVGKQRSSITNSLRLLGLPPEVMDMVSRGTISAGHGRALLGLESSGDQLAAARYVTSKGFSVRRTEAFVKRKVRKHHTRPRTEKMAGLGEWENKLQQRFSTHVAIAPGKKGGKIEFEFYSQEDLERLLEAWGVL